MEIVSKPNWTFSPAWGNRVVPTGKNERTMKRWMILISLMALLPSLLTPSFSAETPLKTIIVAVPAVSLLQAPLFVAIDAGAFKKYSMDVRYFLTGARTIQSLVGGS